MHCKGSSNWSPFLHSNERNIDWSKKKSETWHWNKRPDRNKQGEEQHQSLSISKNLWTRLVFFFLAVPDMVVILSPFIFAQSCIFGSMYVSSCTLQPYLLKVRIFKEGHKNWWKLHRRFDTSYLMSNRRWRFRQFVVAFLDEMNFTHIQYSCYI